MRPHRLAIASMLLLTACAHSAPPDPISVPAALFDYATATLDRSTPEATARSLMTAM